jgi:metal-responsive CopG/Arc/MetJ family transcriptional regulator
MPPLTAEDLELREGLSVSIYPITTRQWEALQEIAESRGETRADLFREAIERLCDDRDAGREVIYRAAVRLDATDKVGIKPRIVWLKSPLSERFLERIEKDRAYKSEFVLEALRRYLATEKIVIDPPI